MSTTPSTSRLSEAAQRLWLADSSDFIRLCRANWEILEGRRWAALRCVLLLGAAGLSEGTAIMMLIPALKGLTVGTADIPLWNQGLATLGQTDSTLAALGLFLVLGLASTLLSQLSKQASLRLRVNVENAVRTSISRSLMDVRWDMFHSLRLGDIGKSVVVEAVQIAACAQMFLQGMGTLLVILAFLLLALALSAPMTVITLFFAGLGALLFSRANRLSRAHSDALTDIISGIGVRVSDTFNHLKFLRASGMTSEINASSGQDYTTYGETFYKSQNYGITLRFWQESAAILFVWLLLCLGLTTGRVDPLIMMVFLAVFFRLSPRLFALYEHFFQSRGYMNWYWVWKQRFEFAREHAIPPCGMLEPRHDREIRFEALSYTFPGAGSPSLRDVSFGIPRGACIAVVGPSGCGKSTFADIILGLLRPTSGQVTLDGVPLWNTDVEHWRKRIGLVLQDSPIFHASVLENITWGEAIQDRHRAEDAAHKANAWDFISQLPHGLDDIVGEKGSRLSGGQRQRIALARALYREPWLLLLDEATSALDSESEGSISNTLNRIKGSCTIIIMAHQLRTVSMADSILVLEKGRLVESGDWHSLLCAEGGYFSRMAQLQGIIAPNTEGSEDTSLLREQEDPTHER